MRSEYRRFSSWFLVPAPSRIRRSDRARHRIGGRREAKTLASALVRSSQPGLRLDENRQRLRHHAIMRHRLHSRGALHEDVQRIHVRHIHHHTYPLRVLRVHEGPDVGDAKRSKQFLSLRRAQPMVPTFRDVVICKDRRHVLLSPSSESSDLASEDRLHPTLGRLSCSIPSGRPSPSWHRACRRAWSPTTTTKMAKLY